MKKLLRTLYILTPDSYLYWRNENVCIKVGGTEKVAIPGADVGCDRLLWPDDGFYSSSASLRRARDQRHVSQRKRAVSGQFLRPVRGNVLLRSSQ